MEQWESLKGPSGIDRLDEVRNGLRGRATEMAFNRRAKRETEQVAELDRQVTEWQAMTARLMRLREAAGAAGTLSAEAFSARLAGLAAALTLHDPDLDDDPATAPGDRLAAIHRALEGLRTALAQRRVFLDGLADLPARYAGQIAAADPEAPALVEARQAAVRTAENLLAAATNTAAARENTGDAAARSASADALVRALDAARADHELTVRSRANLSRLGAERESQDANLTSAHLELEGLEADLAAIQDRAAILSGLRSSTQSSAVVSRDVV